MKNIYDAWRLALEGEDEVGKAISITTYFAIFVALTRCTQIPLASRSTIPINVQKALLKGTKIVFVPQFVEYPFPFGHATAVSQETREDYDGNIFGTAMSSAVLVRQDPRMFFIMHGKLQIFDQRGKVQVELCKSGSFGELLLVAPIAFYFTKMEVSLCFFTFAERFGL